LLSGKIKRNSYIFATSTMPSRQVSSESFSFSISLQDNIQTVGFRIIQRSIHKIKEFCGVAGKIPEYI
jgi:hypothetical protein